MSALQHDRVASENAKERETRLQQMSALQCDRLAFESDKDREV